MTGAQPAGGPRRWTAARGSRCAALVALVALATLGACVSSSAAATASRRPPPEARPAGPPSTRTFDVRAFGAKGGGVAIDGDVINRAIEAAAAAGDGTVDLPAGTYASYSVRLRSHVALHLEQGATLLATDPHRSRSPRAPA